VTYEPRKGGRIEMEVSIDGAAARYGGPIVVFEPERGRELFAAGQELRSEWVLAVKGTVVRRCHSSTGRRI
jgi:aspartyl-tRNA synthetase